MFSGLNSQSQTCSAQRGLRVCAGLAGITGVQDQWCPSRACWHRGSSSLHAQAGEGAGSVCSPSQELLLSAAPISPSIFSHPSLPLSLSLHSSLHLFNHPSLLLSIHSSKDSSVHLYDSFPPFIRPFMHPSSHPSIPPSLSPPSGTGKGWRSGAIFGSVSLATAATTVCGGFYIGAKIFHTSY